MMADGRHGTGHEAHLSEVQRCTITTIVVIPVHVEDLLALDRQEAGEDTFGKTGTKNDDLRDGHQLQG